MGEGSRSLLRYAEEVGRLSGLERSSAHYAGKVAARSGCRRSHPCGTDRDAAPHWSRADEERELLRRGRCPRTRGRRADKTEARVLAQLAGYSNSRAATSTQITFSMRHRAWPVALAFEYNKIRNAESGGACAARTRVSPLATGEIATSSTQTPAQL